MKSEILKQSGYLPALRLGRVLSPRTAGFILTIFAFATVVFLDLSVFYESEFFAGWMEVSLAIFLLSLVYWLFLQHLRREHTYTEGSIKKILDSSQYGGTLTFFLTKLIYLVADDQGLSLQKFWLYLLGTYRFKRFLLRWNIPENKFLEQVKARFRDDAVVSLETILALSLRKALENEHLPVRLSDVLLVIYENDKQLQEMMTDFDVREEDIYSVARWYRRYRLEIKAHEYFWSEDRITHVKGIGKDWSGGYTVNLDNVAWDITRVTKLKKIPPHLYGRGQQVESLQRLLVAGSRNAVIVGNPGVGRHTLLQMLASAMNWGLTFGPLRYRRMLQIDSATILSGTENLSNVLDKIKVYFGEAYAANNIVLVINDIDAFLDPNPEAGRVNATEALLPFFESGLMVVGITTPGGYAATIGKNPQLERLFGKLELEPPSLEETLMIVQDEVYSLERKSGLVFTQGALRELVNLTDRLVQNLPNPEKSLEVLEETAVYVNTKTNDRIVIPDHVRTVLSQRTKIPVENVAGEEKEKLLNLEEVLHQRIVGQDEAIVQISNALRRARAGIASGKRPLGSFLFLGPTGVGKTETTKALAAIYFGSEERIVRFDMSEFQEPRSINRLIGDADSKTGGLLTEAIIANPFSLILLDELEKAHPNVLDLFLQVLDDGRLTDSLGRVVSFVNTIIIATSNAGAEQIRELVAAGKSLEKEQAQVIDYLQREGLFRPEFLNRFDATVMFRSLTEDELTQVAVLLLNELNRRLAEKDIQVKVTKELAESLARGGYDPEFGARPLRRYIQEKVENYIAKGLLSGEIKKGDEVVIDPASFVD